MTNDQRFCPLCNRAFVAGEAVLRCEGCGVLHHPGCWVTNNGCATQREHDSRPVAQAYTAPGIEFPARPGSHTARPGHTYSGASSSMSYVKPQRASQADATADASDPSDGEGLGEADEAAMIGAGQAADDLPRVRRQGASRTVEPPRAPRRYEDGTRSADQTRLPRIYGRRRPIDYWYIPAAIIVAAAVAVGVVLGVDKFTGGSNTAATVASPTHATSPTAAATSSVSATPVASATLGAAAQAASVAAAGTELTIGKKAVVTNTGDCLNVRTAPATSNPAIVCLKDGSSVNVAGGPQTGEGYTWWKVDTQDGEGWAVGTYLAPQS